MSRVMADMLRATARAIRRRNVEIVRAGAVASLLADGGPTESRTLMQLQAKVSGRVVARSVTAELSALGAAHLAGRVAGLWTDLGGLDRPRRFEPREDADVRQERVAAWHHAVERARLRSAREMGASVAC